MPTISKFANQKRNPGRDRKRQERLGMTQKRKRQSPRTAHVPWLTGRFKPCLVALHQRHHSLPEVLEACLQTQLKTMTLEGTHKMTSNLNRCMHCRVLIQTVQPSVATTFAALATRRLHTRRTKGLSASSAVFEL